MTTKKRLALAVSGGVDSMVMLHMYAHGSESNDFFVVTVDHGIRKEAGDDCRFVADYCKKLGVECRIFQVDAPAYAKENKLSLETAARILRYGVLDGLDCDFVCLAHNADDNAETVLMHIVRGSGAKGAVGMKAVNGRYMRPLLDRTRESIEQYAKANGVPHVEDQTNSDTKYTRNFIRHKVIPLLAEINPAVKENILRFARNIAKDDMRLDMLAQRDVDKVAFDQEGAYIPVQLFCGDDYRLLDKVFRRLGVHCDIEEGHYQAICDIAQKGGGKQVHLPFGYVAYNDYDKITICKQAQRADLDFCIPFCLGKTVTPLGVAEVTQSKVPDALRIDVSKVPADAVFRTRRTGDVFTKFGGGTKPLKNYLINKKIPERKRDELLLIASGNEVLAIAGVEISEKLRVTEGDGYFFRVSPADK